MTFAAMEETLKKYRDTEKAMRDIPILHMITEPADSMERRANKLAEAIAAKNKRVHAEVIPVQDQIGGGSAPMVYLPGFGVAVSSDDISTPSMEKQLRENDMPIVARIHDDRLLLCVRTIGEEEVQTVADAFEGME